MLEQFDPSNLNYLSSLLIALLLFLARKYIVGLDTKFDKLDQKMDKMMENADMSMKELDHRLVTTRESLVSVESKTERNADDIQKLFGIVSESKH